MPNVEFKPRRLGHVNLYVSDLERSITFYEKVCGIELVRREPEIRGGFHSNGNTHHDIGLIEVSKGIDRRGRDGKVQIAASRGTKVGLNHLGWEMENEADLVTAYKRFRDLGRTALRLSDHIISHSVYVSDPDGNVHEFYADAIPDWRKVFNLDHEDLVTSQWDPFAAPAKTVANYPIDPPVRVVRDAPLHPSKISGATFATNRFDEMHRFFTSIGGLYSAAAIAVRPRTAVFAGTCGRPDLTLVEVSKGERIGIRMFSFVLASDCDFTSTVDRLSAFGVKGVRLVEDSERRSLVIDDPDGFGIEFCRPRKGDVAHPLAA